jgi:hypothetical protein
MWNMIWRNYEIRSFTMRPFKNLTIMLVMFFGILTSSAVNAGILWERELVLDANTNSVPLASCVNKDSNGIIVMTRESPKGKSPAHGGDLVLWEIGIDGGVTRTMPKDASGNQIWTSADYIGHGCRIASGRLGNLLTVGILSKQGEHEQKIADVSKADKEEKKMSILNSIEHYSIIKMIPLKDNSFVLVGERSGNGSCLRVDGQGRTTQEKLFDIDQTNIFSGVVQAKSYDSNLILAISGLSFGNTANDPNGNFSKNFIFICDSNLKTIYEDYFTGGVPRLLFPKVCCLDNGNIVVLYKKESADPNKTSLWARCYTNELKLLWNKGIFVADNMPFAMDITDRESWGFTVGIIQNMVQRSNALELDSFDDEGNKIEQINYKGLIGLGGFNLMNLNNKMISVIEEGTPGNIKEASIRAKVIALD